MNTQIIVVDGIDIKNSILLESGIAIVFDFLDKPSTHPVSTTEGVEVFYYDNLFIFTFDTEERREAYNDAFIGLTSSSNGYIPRIGNFFERNDKYYSVGDYDDTRLADVSDATKTNWILYRWVVINPVVFWEQQKVKTLVDKCLP